MRQLPFVRTVAVAAGAAVPAVGQKYYEDDLGVKWPEVLDKLAGRGITIATKAGEDNARQLVIVHGTDPEFTKKFFQLAVTAIEQEAAREGAKVGPEKYAYRGVEGLKFGDAFLAPVGPNLYFAAGAGSQSTRAVGLLAPIAAKLYSAMEKTVIQRALDVYLDKKKSLANKKGPADAKRALPADPLAWLWFDLAVAHNAPGAKAAYTVPSDNVIQMLIAGSTLNAIGRAPFLAAALVRDKDTFQITVRMPGGGRDRMPEGLALHVPPKGFGAALVGTEGRDRQPQLYLDFKALWSCAASCSTKDRCRLRRRA